LDEDKIILNLSEENRELTEEWHRLKIENEWMAREIKGARFLISKMLETLCLDHDKKEFKVVKNSNVREDLMCFQNLTKKLLHAVESGLVQKVEVNLLKNTEPGGEGAEKLDDMKPLSKGEEQAAILHFLGKETKDLTDKDGNVKIRCPRSRLPRIEELPELQREVRPRKTRRMVVGYNMKQRNAAIPAVLHHVHGISRKKRWSSNCGAPRQAFTTRRNC